MANNEIEILPEEALCEDCTKIDFHAAGFHSPNDPDYNFFALDEIPLANVFAKAEECPFCAKTTSFFKQWANNTYGHDDCLKLSDARVSYSALRVASSQSDGDGNQELPSLFRITVSFTIRDPFGEGWIGPTLEYQRYTLESVYDTKGYPIGETGDLQDKHPYSGRLRPLVANCNLFRQWKDDCLKCHGKMCEGLISEHKPPSPFRLINVLQNCLVEVSHDVKWLTLSYVWGGDKDLSLQQHNLDDFKRPGSLCGDKVPRTILDAMTLTKAVGETYLWVDRLCIIQDNSADSRSLIAAMDVIYSQSVLTIIDAAGSDANGSLPGIRPKSRSRVQKPFAVKGVGLVQTLDPVNVNSVGYLAESVWNSRGWTFQEGILAPRTLIFTPEQVFWQCSQASWCEDGFWEHQSPVMYRHFLRDEFRDLWSGKETSPEAKYRQLVEEYSQRKLTREDDGLDAFQGIMGALLDTYHMNSLYGLPDKYLGAALTWPAHDEGVPVRRREGEMAALGRQGSDGWKIPFPSWSWVGWVGKIHFDEVFGALTSRHAGLVFYMMGLDGKPVLIVQEDEFRDKYEQTSPMQLDGRSDRPNPLWRDSSRTEITAADTPQSMIERDVYLKVLGFWSSVLPVRVHYVHNGRNWDTVASRSHQPMLTSSGIELQAAWQQMLRHEDGIDAEDCRLIIIGRDTLCSLRGREELCAILADAETDEGLTYRKALVSIRESEWNQLEGKTWEKVFLA